MKNKANNSYNSNQSGSSKSSYHKSRTNNYYKKNYSHYYKSNNNNGYYERNYSQKENFDYKKMYENYAKVWMVTMTRQTAQSINAVDTHSPASIRVNRVLQSSDKFYEVYGITENDGMWVKPEDRARIW